MKILVIDDEKPTLSMFRLFLAAYGYEVFTAEDGETGLARFREIRPGIVFTDIKMPGIDGLQVLGRIREMDPHVQVIIITGHGDLEKAIEALDLDASDFINKPVERQALNSALARAEKRAGITEPPEFSCNFSIKQGQAKILFRGRLTGKADKKITPMLEWDEWPKASKADFSFDESFSIDREGIRLLMDILMKIKLKKLPVLMKGLSYNYIRFFQMAGMDKLAEFQTRSEETGG
ncbi:response regulator [Desulfospira joergensenii]|uniref:response regulator n=1 Tax=Desulfospira joergensenii TaxID=53329 RepID=UPI0003B2FE90|nr:response regulator [Desulfospira joergensenii]